jgi:EAL domain-containing protein (putative c-di-GMP-specific phosphodiesterase class I)
VKELAQSTETDSTPAEPSRSVLRGRVLLVDDEPLILALFGRVLRGAGFAVQEVSDARNVADILSRHRFDVVVSDLAMPEVDGIAILKVARATNPDLPVILMTGQATVSTAVKAVEFGALRYLTKPVDPDAFVKVVEEAAEVHQAAQTRQRAVQYYNHVARRATARADLNARLDRAIASIYMVYQPIVRWSDRSVFAYEALVRTAEQTLGAPEELLAAAEALDRLQDVGRVIRRTVAHTLSASPMQEPLLVNLHSRDLDDDDLLSALSPLSMLASRIVLEVTERAALDASPLMQRRLDALRKAGYRVAVDDLGSGYSGLTSLAHLHPEIVKLDISLTRGVWREPTKRKLVEMMVKLCRELGMELIAEGVETCDDRDALIDSGCDLLQGYLFGAPGPAFPSANWREGNQVR